MCVCVCVVLRLNADVAHFNFFCCARTAARRCSCYCGARWGGLGFQYPRRWHWLQSRGNGLCFNCTAEKYSPRKKNYIFFVTFLVWEWCVYLYWWETIECGDEEIFWQSSAIQSNTKRVLFFLLFFHSFPCLGCSRTIVFSMIWRHLALRRKSAAFISTRPLAPTLC